MSFVSRDPEFDLVQFLRGDAGSAQNGDGASAESVSGLGGDSGSSEGAEDYGEVDVGEVEELDIEEEVEDISEEGGEEGGEELSDSDRRLIDYVKRHFGVDLSQYRDDFEALKSLVEAKKFVGRRNEESAAWRTLVSKYGEDFVNSLLEKDPRELLRSAVEQEQPRTIYGEAEFDPSWLDWLTYDERGNIIAKEGAPPDLLPKVKKFAQRREQIIIDFVRSPEKFIEQVFEQVVFPKFQARIDQLLAVKEKAKSRQEELQDWIEAHRDAIIDSEGQPTPLGELFFEIADQVAESHQRSYGYVDPKLVFEEAWERLQASVQTKKQTEEQPRRAKPAAKVATNRTNYVDWQRRFEELVSQDGVTLSQAYQQVMREMRRGPTRHS